MRASEFLNEENFGVSPKRQARDGSRPARGHEPEPRYKTNEPELDEAGKASRSLCLSKKSNAELGASQLSSCKAQGLRKRETNRKFPTGGSKKPKSIKGTYVKASDYGGPLPKWKGN
jgi:hypothetical protein